MSASDGRGSNVREISTAVNNALVKAGAAPAPLPMRVDVNKVIERANEINVRLFPHLELSANPDLEELTQQIALVMVAETRFRQMGLTTPEGRAHVLQAALSIMKNTHEREVTSLAQLGPEKPAGKKE